MPFSVIDHVQLAMPAGKEDEARSFYAGMLGFVEIAKPAELASRGGAWFRSGDVAIHLGVDPEFRPARKAHPALRCDAYADLLERLERSGVHVVRDDFPFERRAHCYVADPFGNRLELIDG
ncbi:MAG TPA: VOC family protein [Candidatus Cybelea sp.]|jgi:catechol 2,3-dioxygenase-like lactoylglutathione lyase family enzyme|nr:VOC family protein [Candidatus Cybelea sp.]